MTLVRCLSFQPAPAALCLQMKVCALAALLMATLLLAGAPMASCGVWPANVCMRQPNGCPMSRASHGAACWAGPPACRCGTRAPFSSAVPVRPALSHPPIALYEIDHRGMCPSSPSNRCCHALPCPAANAPPCEEACVAFPTERACTSGDRKLSCECCWTPTGPKNNDGACTSFCR